MRVAKMDTVMKEELSLSQFSGARNKMNVTSARPPFVGLFDFEILVRCI